MLGWRATVTALDMQIRKERREQDGVASDNTVKDNIQERVSAESYLRRNSFQSLLGLLQPIRCLKAQFSSRTDLLSAFNSNKAVVIFANYRKEEYSSITKHCRCTINTCRGL